MSRVRPQLRLKSLAPFIALLACSPEAQEVPVASGAPGAEPGQAASSVIVVSIDTLRSDHLPVYGYAGVTTPEIDRLAADGVVFERAFAHTPLTLPSHVSMFSGVLPNRHGVRDNLGFRVPTDIEWLPETLQARGFATAAAVSSAVLQPSTGMGRGFDLYDDGSSSAGSEAVRAGDATVAAALRWIDQLSSDRFFLFVHLYEPHRPYAPPTPFDTFESAYDGEIATADAAVGTLFEGLRTRDLYDSSLIVLTSDHGESLGEHGERDHGVFVYRESLQVPLIVKLAGNEQAGRRELALVQHADLMPTILDALDEASGQEGDGISLLDTSNLNNLPRERLIYGESYLPRLYFGASELHTLIGPRFQYIDSPQPELFDLVADPASLDNLIDNDPEAVENYRRLLAPLTTSLAAADPVADKQRRELAALGYLGGAAPPLDDDLPAPREHLELLAVVSEAYDAVSAGRLEDARLGFQRAVEINPLAAFAWAQLSRAERALGRNEEALAAALEALELTGEAPHRLLPAARLALGLRKFDQAEALAQKASDWSPAESLALRCRVALARGDLAGARDLALAALDADPARTPPALQVMSIHLGSGQPQQALTLGESVETRVATPPFGLNLMLGQALTQVGRYDEAVTRLEREIALFPERPRTYGHLALLYGRLERGEDTGRTIDRLLASVPGAARYVTAIQTLAQLGFPDDAMAVLGRALGEYPDDPALLELARIANTGQGTGP